MNGFAFLGLWFAPSLMFVASWLVAKRMSLTRLRWLDPVVVVWGAIGPTWMMRWPDAIRDWTGWPVDSSAVVGAFVFIMPPSLVTAVLLGLSARSVIPAGFAVAAGVAGAVVALLIPMMYIPSMIVWNVVTAVGMLTWARAAREALSRPGCRACGYSLVGLKGTTCPECGAAIGVIREAVAARA